MRSASLLGRAFSLRDRGRLEEALTVCREALAVAQDPRVGAESTIAFSTVVVGALTIDEIATRLGTPDLARKPLEDALRMFELIKRKSVRQLRPDKNAQVLLDKEQQIRTRLEELGSPER
jgi:hypothetical protein